MKKRISATVEEEKIKFLKEIVKKEKYRNSSHAIEKAIKLLREKIKNEK